MSSLIMTLPNSFPAPRPQWLSHASAAVVTVALHAAVFGLLLHGWTPELTAPSSTQVLKTQLVSLPAPQPVLAAPVEPEPTPLPEPVETMVRDVVEEPQVDPRIEQHRLEQAELAYKRAELERRAEEQRVKERQRKQQLERERQERLEVERQQHETQRREQLAREARQREQAAQAEAAAAAERARQAEAAAAASRQYLPIAKDAPAYPQRALDKGIEGTCTVSYSVNPQGRIENPKALDDCHPLFIRPSLSAAKSFRYQPRVIDGRAVSVPEVKNTFHYRIQ
ncbi:TonB family protein [Pseudomonas sp. MTM4]|uniref:TonB family protein n=1 Tax=unclassified Pseudomonas TaxID=196821 RepID=UPI0018D26D1A|nr:MULTISPECIES: TonB family protein [unclassified Pseudomonas]MBC8650860.1 TonB family protein [Pseudomonas sp. MT4]QXY91184.1 TonB family protein [Pseudomonas sp. MTM4]